MPERLDRSSHRRDHWQSVYTDKADSELSWFQERPEQSLALIRTITPRPVRILDVGGGQSALVGGLLDEGPDDPPSSIAVLDLAPAAIERAKARLGPRSDRVRWIVGDVLDAEHLPQVDLWHDRAVFHFLVAEEDQRRYAERAAAAVVPGGHLIVATFGPEGPEKCSGLPVARHDAASLEAAFAPRFRLVDSAREVHTTPWGKPQEFTYAVLRRIGS
ncbi:MAG: class I SAM-dependent methyltransferase [Phycisphaerales bacterium]